MGLEEISLYMYPLFTISMIIDVQDIHLGIKMSFVYPGVSYVRVLYKQVYCINFPLMGHFVRNKNSFKTYTFMKICCLLIYLIFSYQLDRYRRGTSV